MLAAQSTSAVQIAPDCDTRAMLPASHAVRQKDALRPIDGRSMPMQFGPRMRTSASRATASTRASSALPASPVSLKPAESTMAAGTPARPACAMMSGTAGAGAATTARSTGPGRSSSEA